MEHNLFDDDDMSNDSVEILRARVNAMKRLMAERNMHNNNNPNTTNNNNDGKTGNGNAPTTEELWSRSSSATTRHSGIINGQFLSIVLCTTLGVIVTVAFYAFYNLYHAVLKKFPSRHTEL